jgi:DNA segregation ATPase FtsK/SpoIIIE-like protein
MTYRLELGADRFIDISTPKVALCIKYETDLNTGKAIAHIESRNIFDNYKLDDAFNKGFQEYVESINDENSCKRRLSLYQKRINLRNEVIARNAEREKRYLAASADWKKSKSTKFQLEIFMKLIGAIPIYFLWEADHGIIAGIYLILYLIVIFVPFTSSLQSDPPNRDAPERLPFACDPIYEAFGDFYNGEEDFLYGRAVAIVLETNRASASLLQRHLKMGYNRALKLIESMEAVGIVSKADYEGKRTVLI